MKQRPRLTASVCQSLDYTLSLLVPILDDFRDEGRDETANVARAVRYISDLVNWSNRRTASHPTPVQECDTTQCLPSRTPRRQG